MLRFVTHYTQKSLFQSPVMQTISDSKKPGTKLEKSKATSDGCLQNKDLRPKTQK